MSPAIDGSIPQIASTPAVGQNPANSPATQSTQGLNLSSTQVVVGKQFQGEVLSRLNDGTFIVKIADIAARMQLPAGVQVGAKLPFTLMTQTPRPTFLLEMDGKEHTAIVDIESEQDSLDQTAIDTKNNSANPALYQRSGVGNSNANLNDAAAKTTASSASSAVSTPATTAPQLLKLGGQALDSAPATFSSAGKLISQLLQTTAGQSTITTSKTPLLSGPEKDVNVLSQALKNGVSNSGVFYESHLVQWAEGSRSLDQIMKEPQAQIPVGVSTTATASSTMTSSPETSNLIGQQLHTLEQHSFTWQGQLWPGQSLEMEIRRDAPNTSSNQQEPTWQSTVRFELPQLGTIVGKLHLLGEHVQIRLQTDTDTIAKVLQQNAPTLANALAVSGATLDTLLVNSGAKEHD